MFDSFKSTPEVVHGPMEVVLSYFDISTIISIETLLAVLASLIFSFLIFLVLRRYNPVTRIILPGLVLTRLAKEKATKILKQDKAISGNQYDFISGVLLAYALRGAASLIVVAWIFATMVSVVAPLF